ncbi:MAG: BrnT family toxin [Lachnospiraceae bacterium]|nr:BrnT family toxin [Lachnospiraceae bacterium]
MQFEYDEYKNQKNIEKHGISFKSAARVFFDYDRIEYFDEQESREEDRFDIIGDLSAGSINLFGGNDSTIGNIGKDTVVFVVYTERVKYIRDNKEVEVIRIISARYATSFERGIYYGKY